MEDGNTLMGNRHRMSEKDLTVLVTMSAFLRMEAAPHAVQRRLAAAAPVKRDKNVKSKVARDTARIAFRKIFGPVLFDCLR